MQASIRARNTGQGQGWQVPLPPYLHASTRAEDRIVVVSEPSDLPRVHSRSEVRGTFGAQGTSSHPCQYQENRRSVPISTPGGRNLSLSNRQARMLRALSFQSLQDQVLLVSVATVRRAPSFVPILFPHFAAFSLLIFYSGFNSLHYRLPAAARLAC